MKQSEKLCELCKRVLLLNLRMKKFSNNLTIMFIILTNFSTSPCIAKSSSPQYFESKKQFEKWVKTSHLGGHIEDIYNPGLNTRVYAAYRSFTSGVVTSDLSVYVMTKLGGYSLIYHHPKVNGNIKPAHTDDSVLFIHYSGFDKDKIEIIKELTIADVIHSKACISSKDCNKNQYCHYSNPNSELKFRPYCLPCPKVINESSPKECKK